MVVSTLGSHPTPEAASILKGLDVEHFIVAYNWDEAGRNGLEQIAAKLGGWVYYRGSLAEGQDPYDMLKSVVDAISGFSLKHLRELKRKHQAYTTEDIFTEYKDICIYLGK